MTAPKDRAAVARLAAQCKHNGEKLTAATLPITGALFELAADTLLALLARAEAAEHRALNNHIHAQHMEHECDAVAAQVAAAVEAEREAAAQAMLARCIEAADEQGSWGTAFETRKRILGALDAIRARGPSSALADALRQAEARGMREAAEVARTASLPRRLVEGGPMAGWQTFPHEWPAVITAAIVAAADAKEKGDG